MPDRQGRGPYEDESRIERPNMRPLENPGGGDDPREPFRKRVDKILKPEDSGNFGGGNMSSAQNLADQLGWCNTTRHYLQDLQNDIRHVARIYAQTLEDLQGDQYPRELFDRFPPLRDEFYNRAEATVRHIDDVHIDYVDQQSDSVSTQLSVIMNLPTRV